MCYIYVKSNQRCMGIYPWVYIIQPEAAGLRLYGMQPRVNPQGAWNTTHGKSLYTLD